MKNLLLAFLASTGLLAFAGCADDGRSVTTEGSTTLSSDSKNMTHSSVTPSDAATTTTQTTTVTTQDTPDYSAIHSNGQH